MAGSSPYSNITRTPLNPLDPVPLPSGGVVDVTYRLFALSDGRPVDIPQAIRSGTPLKVVKHMKPPWDQWCGQHRRYPRWSVFLCTQPGGAWGSYLVHTQNQYGVEVVDYIQSLGGNQAVISMGAQPSDLAAVVADFGTFVMKEIREVGRYGYRFKDDLHIFTSSPPPPGGMAHTVRRAVSGVVNAALGGPTPPVVPADDNNNVGTKRPLLTSNNPDRSVKPRPSLIASPRPSVSVAPSDPLPQPPLLDAANDLLDASQSPRFNNYAPLVRPRQATVPPLALTNELMDRLEVIKRKYDNNGGQNNRTAAASSAGSEDNRSDEDSDDDSDRNGGGTPPRQGGRQKGLWGRFVAWMASIVCDPLFRGCLGLMLVCLVIYLYLWIVSMHALRNSGPMA